MKKSKQKQAIQIQEPSGLNLKQLFFSIRKNRYWFLMFAIIGLFAAFLYNLLVPQKYNIITSVLVKTDNSQALLTSIHPEIEDDKKGTIVQDQVGVLSSYVINLQTLENLKWNVSWAEKGFITNTDLYKDVPFKLDTPENSNQIKGIPIEIRTVNNEHYIIKCDEVKEVNGKKHKISFEDKGSFGKPFKNSYFNFTLTKIPGKLIDDGESFMLTFNDVGALAKSYQEELKITPGDDGSDLITIELPSRQPERAIDYLSELDKGIYKIWAY